MIEMRQFGKFEIHKVFLHFPNLALAQNLSAGTKAEPSLEGSCKEFYIIMYLKKR